MSQPSRKLVSPIRNDTVRDGEPSYKPRAEGPLWVLAVWKRRTSARNAVLARLRKFRNQ